MTFVIPAFINNHRGSFGSDALARGDFTEGTFNTKNTKAQGSLPITAGSATQVFNTTTAGTAGVHWEFNATPSEDVSVDTKVIIIVYQYNAPNRMQIDTLALNGVMVRIGTGGATPPANHRTFQVGGRDTAIGQAREFPVHVVIDLNVANHEALVGTFDNTDVQTYGWGSKKLDMGEVTSQRIFWQPAFLLETTKGATDIPRFTGAGSDWDDIITAMGLTFDDKITHGWLGREGEVFSVACPWEIGNNSTITTFNDNGVAVFWPDDDEVGNPRIRVTEQAFRGYLNLRDNVADTATFSGTYDCGNSYPPWNFDQDDAAVVTFTSPTFQRVGTFLMGSSITGPATFDDCGVVDFQDNGVDLDGSTFSNPHADHLLSLVA